MPRKLSELSKSQIGKIRANMARKATQISNRLSAFSLDTDETVKMSATQVNAAKVVLAHVLPSQATTEFSDVTEPEKTPEQMESEYQQALENLPVQDLTEVLRNMEPEARQALIDSMGETSQ